MFKHRNALLASMALAGATPAFALDCHKFNDANDFVGRLTGRPEAQGLSACFSSPEALKSELWARLQPLIEEPIDYGDFVETSTVTPGGCSPYGFDGNGYPIHRCTYSVKTVNRAKLYDYQTTSTTNSYFGMVMNCGARLNSTWRPDLGMCMGYRDKRPVEMCTAKKPVGNPIDALTGRKSQQEQVLSWGRGHSLVLSYDPLDESQNLSRYRGSTPRFGALWHSNLHKQALQNGGGLGYITFLRGDGSMKIFDSYGDTRSPLERDRLKWLGYPASWNYYDMAASAVERYVSSNLSTDLKRIHYADGRSLDFTYGLAKAKEAGTMMIPVIAGVTDETGRTLSFEYEPDPVYFSTVRVKAVVDPAGRRFTFGYAGEGLATIGSPDGTTRGYVYGNASLPWAITARIDESGAQYGTYEYDSAGRAISTATGSQGERWGISWTRMPKWVITETDDLPNRRIVRERTLIESIQAVLIGPDGRREVADSVPLMSSPMLTGQSQPAGAGCEAASSSVDYDGEANAIRRADFNGAQSCHAYVAGRQLESARVEGLAAGTACSPVLTAGAPVPTGARKVTSQWHPDWRMATKTAEPRRITTLVYNGQPDPFNGNAVASCAPADAKLPDDKPIVVLCKRVEQATTDETGALGFGATLQTSVPARATSWTYNATGQVLTETDSLNRVVVTNEYYADTTIDHTKGDLKSSKNAAGHLTNFTRYDAYGKPLEAVNANATATTYTYDLRERLTSVTSAGSTTSYEYWPTGLLEKSSQPDGSAVNYEYDDAHRLVAASDTQGNRVEYTLDQSGNKTGEVAKDPQGALKRTMSRAFDALGRAQQTTGRE
ncbi:hypothetical protein ACFJIX_13490 [Roseateles sp. UC29_93]|uniref:hypothetical protein n=1 Tax=Roseateles sp. UC29_93 TaxID=3350177 RepID=UPI00366CE7BD